MLQSFRWKVSSGEKAQQERRWRINRTSQQEPIPNVPGSRDQQSSSTGECKMLQNSSVFLSVHGPRNEKRAQRQQEHADKSGVFRAKSEAAKDAEEQIVPRALGFKSDSGRREHERRINDIDEATVRTAINHRHCKNQCCCPP